MIEKAWLSVVALVAAYLLVTLIPGLAPEVSARTADKIIATRLATAENPTLTACTESWPYYQPECLRDDRQPDGRARAVRIISAEHSAVESSGSPAL